MSRILSCLIILAIFGCVTPGALVELTEGGKKVEARMPDAPPGYIQLGPVFGRHGRDCERGVREEAIKDLRNNGAEMGADYIRIDSVLAPDPSRVCGYQEYTIRGVAFKKPAK